MHRINEHWSFLTVLHRLADAASILAATWLVYRWVHDPQEDTILLLPAAAIIGHYLISELTGLYRNWQGASLEHELACSLISWLYTVPTVVLLGFLLRHSDILPRRAVLAWL